MITYEMALQLAEKEVSKGSSEYIIDKNNVIEFELGWLFTYNTKKFLETNDYEFALIGNAPIIVDKKTGNLHYTDTVHTIEEHIKRYKSH